MAQKHHPDKGGNDESFQLIQTAYNFISESDEKKTKGIKER